MASSFFYSKPTCSNNFVSVADVQNQLQAFNLMYELTDPNGGSAANCPDPNMKAQWRNAVRDGVVNCAGKPTELDFMEQIAGGKTTRIDATDLYIKTNCDVDYNILAQDAVTGGAPGATTSFTVATGLYGGNGNYSNVAEGGSIYIYEDAQWVQVQSIDRTVPYAHVVTIVPYSATYQVNIRAGAKMMFNASRIVGGESCPVPASTWMTNGYISKVQPLRIRKDWKVPVDLMRGYKDVLQFAFMFDREGRKVDSWEYKNKITAREELKYAENLDYFLGQKIDNPNLIGTVVDEKYAGFEGYLPTVRYAGGVIADYDPTIGFDLNADLEPIMLRQDAYKRATEFMAWVGFPFMLRMQQRNNINWRDASGGCTFETFTKMGAQNAADVEKLGIKSYSYGGHTIHFKTMSALSDTRGIGNGEFPYLGMMMPTTGLTDSNGNSVPPIEFFMPGGATETGAYEEHQRDMRDISGCDAIEGYSAKTIMAFTHCPNQHILLQPQFPCN